MERLKRGGLKRTTGSAKASPALGKNWEQAKACFQFFRKEKGT